MTKSYIAFVYGRVPGMVGAVVVDIYAARDMACLTRMVLGRGLAAGETVRYTREQPEPADGLDSDGYPLDQPREWSDDELTELRRREFATDNYGRDI